MKGLKGKRRASKAAINSLARHVASAWGKQGIRANTLGVGVTMTDIAQEQIGAEWQARILATVRGPRLGKPADVAAGAAFLCPTTRSGSTAA
ncbi:SDR family oxidoreductase [Streptomyces sp. SID13726]|uniref:SDR family oxidoreductase n=1 Tax=Streptomyces sp. SID13726 TaxID=2706058 RepID=UPI0013B9EED1|nr:SDR family oxidoreductase [Streptomyces sp. SID13726]NEB00905.1 SDR family oxidoreductase [Streptomyces sp. SID13726]